MRKFRIIKGVIYFVALAGLGVAIWIAPPAPFLEFTSKIHVPVWVTSMGFLFAAPLYGYANIFNKSYNEAWLAPIFYYTSTLWAAFLSKNYTMTPALWTTTLAFWVLAFEHMEQTSWYLRWRLFNKVKE